MSSQPNNQRNITLQHRNKLPSTPSSKNTQPPPSLPADYGERIDFEALKEYDEDFCDLLEENDGRLDFKNAKHVMQLTRTTLRKDFGLRIELPDDRLCPPIPVRYAYIKWLQRLIDSTTDSYNESDQQQTIGIDIGVGASCIYPLLGTALRPSTWKFLGTELDEKSYAYAVRNVESNGFTDRIKLLKVPPGAEKIIPDLDQVGNVSFTMCNPPFYTSKEDMHKSYAEKGEAPNAVCTGAEVEMITEGGDGGFVVRMVEESRTLGGKVKWYTSMLGKLSSAKAVVERLKELGCRNWAVGLLGAGGKTRRWVVGWSWGDLRPALDVARGDVVHKELLPFPTEAGFRLGGWNLEYAKLELNKVMESLDVAWYPDSKTGDVYKGAVFAKENVWSRSARRKKQRKVDAESDDMDVDNDSEDEEDLETTAKLAVRIEMRSDGVSVRWLKGMDYILFESFCGMLKRHFAKSSQ